MVPYAAAGRSLVRPASIRGINVNIGTNRSFGLMVTVE
jgi:hypothetical protein